MCMFPYRPKTEIEKWFSTPGDGTFVQNSIFYKKVPSKNFHKQSQILTYRPKTEFEKMFSTSEDGTFVQNRIAYKKLPSENLHKNAQISTY